MASSVTLPHIVSVHEDVLDEHVWVTAVVEISSDVTYGLGVHDVDVLGFPVVLPSGYKPLLLRTFLGLRSLDADCRRKSASPGQALLVLHLLLGHLEEALGAKGLVLLVGS